MSRSKAACAAPLGCKERAASRADSLAALASILASRSPRAAILSRSSANRSTDLMAIRMGMSDQCQSRRRQAAVNNRNLRTPHLKRS
jgi:hypothetical protein